MYKYAHILLSSCFSFFYILNVFIGFYIYTRVFIFRDKSNIWKASKFLIVLNNIYKLYEVER